MLLIPSSLRATHIVGGEFELIHIDGNVYRLNLILYFDVVNGNPGAFDNFINPWIFRKRDFAKITELFLPFITKTSVPYSIQECARGDLITDRIVYSTTILLDPSDYNDPEGYRIVWERCCRNGTIDNITDPGDSGQKFILDFPPVTRDGNPFVNSSPILFPPLRDYACINQFYFADFAGQDPDGDSLVYSLANPLNTVTVPIPEPSPGISFVVNWSPGININNQVPGNHALRIDKDGLLTVVPSQTGLFVFSIKVDEFRDGVKIGETRRDFQMLVLDCPPAGIPPLVQAKAPNETEFKTELQTIKYSRGDEKCLEFIVTDKELNQDIRLIARPVNFDGDISDILSISQGFINGDQDTLKVEVCFPDCPYVRDEPFIIDFLAFDNTCPQGLIDTLRFSIEIEPPFNSDPFFTNSIKLISQTIKEGDVYSLVIEGVDPDKDSMVLDIIHEGFELEDFGMSFTPQNHVVDEGKVTTTFTWDTGCDEYDFTEFQNFDILMVLDDLDTCNFNNNDTLKLELSVLLPPNTDPVITSDLSLISTNPETNDYQVKIRESLNFNLFGEDMDQDFIVLKGYGVDFDFEDYGIEFRPDSGFSSVTSPLSWNLSCANIDLEARDIFNFIFVVTDRDKCKFPNADSLNFNIMMLPPDNQPPVISYNNLTENIDIINNEIELEITEELILDIIGNDFDNDSITLSLFQVTGESGDLPFGYTFTEKSGLGNVSSLFIWKPKCDELGVSQQPTTYNFRFLVQDDVCYTAQADTIDLRITLKDLVTNNEVFLPPNVFTPNGDTKNDFFELSSLAVPDEMRLPDDNCYNNFEEIKIFNRWGKEVFSSTRRDFKWNGKDMLSGVYYYLMVFSKFQYKGTVSILK